MTDKMRENEAAREEAVCSCGAGHGSLEGHTDWCAALAAAPQPAPAWNGPGEKPHTYSPDYQAMGDCRICGHDHEAHKPAPQPAPMDREALVEVIREAIQPSIISDVIPALAADALLARGLRLPGGGETMAWAVVRKGASLDIHTLFDERPDPKTWRLPKDAEVVRVAIRVVEGGDDAA